MCKGSMLAWNLSVYESAKAPNQHIQAHKNAGRTSGVGYLASVGWLSWELVPDLAAVIIDHNHLRVVPKAERSFRWTGVSAYKQESSSLPCQPTQGVPVVTVHAAHEIHPAHM